MTQYSNLGLLRNKSSLEVKAGLEPITSSTLTTQPRGVLLGIFGVGVPLHLPNPDPILDQKMPFPTPAFRPGVKNPYPFSDLTCTSLIIAYASALNGSQRNKDE